MNKIINFVKNLNKRKTAITSLVLLLMLTGGILIYRQSYKADTNLTSADINFGYFKGKVTIEGTNLPATGFAIYINKQSAAIGLDGSYALSTNISSQANVSFVNLQDNSLWQLADSFEQQFPVISGYHNEDFIIKPIK